MVSKQLWAIPADTYRATLSAGAETTTCFGLQEGWTGVLRPRPLTDWQSLKKTLVDRTLSFLLLIVLAPLLLLIALAVKLESRGPVLFRQPRIGYQNRTFTILKFRSMHHETADLLADRQTSRGDPRVTIVGKYLRCWSLDELPQLWNVLRGDMSLVGPRPHAPNTNVNGRFLDELFEAYVDRHLIKPGLTGWAQVNGARGEICSLYELEKRIRLDLEYINQWSLLLDLKILVLTVIREIISSRAY